MTFTAIVVSHANEHGLRKMLGNLHYQFRRPDETLVYACCLPLARLREEFPWAVFADADHHGDWGHHDRAAGVEAATGDYLGFFNSDDRYSSQYIAELMEATEMHAADVVYCPWNTYPDCEFRLGSSTSGNFIVRATLARKVGYPATKVYENDGHFIDALAEAADVIVRTPHIRYWHNEQ